MQSYRITFMVMSLLFLLVSSVISEGIDGLENIEGWSVYGEHETVKDKISISKEENIVKSENSSLKISRKQGQHGAGGVIKTIPIKDNDGVSLYVYGDNSNAVITIVLSEEDWNMWCYVLPLNFSGWRKLVIPKDSFKFYSKDKPEWDKITYLHFLIERDCETCFYVDEIKYVKGENPLLLEDYWNIMKGEETKILNIISEPYQKEISAGTPVILDISVKDKEDNIVKGAKIRASLSNNILGWREKNDGNISIFIPTAHLKGEYIISIETQKINGEKTIWGEAKFPLIIKETKNPLYSYFPIGLWFSMHSTSDKAYEIVFKDLLEHDINTLVASANPPYTKLLEYAKEYKIKVIAQPPEFEHFWENYSKLSFENIKGTLKGIVNEYSPYNDSLLGYYIMDEPNLRGDDETIIQQANVVKVLFESLHNDKYGFFTYADDYPAHPYENHFKSTLPWILMVDIYPFKSGGNSLKELKVFVKKLDRAYQISNNIPMWILVQASGITLKGEQTLRMPTSAELSAEVYLSISHGAKGVFYFLYNTCIAKPTDPWESFDGLVRGKNPPTYHLFDEGIISTPQWESLKFVHQRLKKVSDLILNWEKIQQFVSLEEKVDTPDIQYFSNKDKKYVFVVNIDTNKSKKFKLILDNKEKLRFSKELFTDKTLTSGTYISWEILPGDAAIFELD